MGNDQCDGVVTELERQFDLGRLPPGFYKVYVRWLNEPIQETISIHVMTADIVM